MITKVWWFKEYMHIDVKGLNLTLCKLSKMIRSLQESTYTWIQTHQNKLYKTHKWLCVRERDVDEMIICLVAPITHQIETKKATWGGQRDNFQRLKNFVLLFVFLSFSQVLPLALLCLLLGAISTNLFKGIITICYSQYTLFTYICIYWNFSSYIHNSSNQTELPIDEAQTKPIINNF